MARKVFTPEEQGKIDLVTSATRERKAKEKADEEKAIRNKKLMYIAGAVLIVGIAFYFIKIKK